MEQWTITDSIFSEEECVVELTIQMKLIQLEIQLILFQQKIMRWNMGESFENGFPENGLVHYNNDGGV